MVIETDSVEQLKETLELNGETKEFKLDTGAGDTAIPSHHYSTDKHGTLRPLRIPLYGPGRQLLDVRGYFKRKLEFLCGDQTDETTVGASSH